MDFQNWQEGLAVQENLNKKLLIIEINGQIKGQLTFIIFDNSSFIFRYIWFKNIVHQQL